MTQSKKRNISVEELVTLLRGGMRGSIKGAGSPGAGL